MNRLASSLCLLGAIAAGILTCIYSFAKKPEPLVVSSQRTQNKFVHVFDDPDAAAAELETAWKRFQRAKGVPPRTDGKPNGFSDERIDELERKIRQRLPADLKAFLKTYLSHGNFINDLELLKPDQIYTNWLERTSIGFDTANNVRFGGPNEGQPYFFDHCVLTFASEHLEDIGYDLRNGKVIEIIDCDAGWMANSLADLFNEMANQIEQGKTISRYDWEIEDLPNGESYRSKLLDSMMWHAYDRPPEKKNSP